jgi:hypothetical protein
MVWDELGFHHGLSGNFMGLSKVPIGVSPCRRRSDSAAVLALESGTNHFALTGNGRGVGWDRGLGSESKSGVRFDLIDNVAVELCIAVAATRGRRRRRRLLLALKR